MRWWWQRAARSLLHRAKKIGRAQGPVSTLAQMLISAVEAPVIDRTGITGQYNFNLKFAPLTAQADDHLPSIFAVLQDQLGLRLEAIKGPVEVLVIDGA